MFQDVTHPIVTSKMSRKAARNIQCFLLKLLTSSKHYAPKLIGFLIQLLRQQFEVPQEQSVKLLRQITYNRCANPFIHRE